MVPRLQPRWRIHSQSASCVYLERITLKASEVCRTLDIHVGNVSESTGEAPTNPQISDPGIGDFSTYSANQREMDPDLARIIAAWPSLPPAVRHMWPRFSFADNPRYRGNRYFPRGPRDQCNANNRHRQQTLFLAELQSIPT
jgi:hypothetical protein